MRYEKSTSRYRRVFRQETDFWLLCCRKARVQNDAAELNRRDNQTRHPAAVLNIVIIILCAVVYTILLCTRLYITVRRRLRSAAVGNNAWDVGEPGRVGGWVGDERAVWKTLMRVFLSPPGRRRWLGWQTRQIHTPHNGYKTRRHRRNRSVSRRCHRRLYVRKKISSRRHTKPPHRRRPRSDIIFSDGKHKPSAAFNIIYTARVYYIILYYYIV